MSHINSLIYLLNSNYRAFGRAHTSTTPQWNWHSIITCKQHVHSPKFFTACHNWFSQVHFQISDQSTTRLSV